MAKELFENYITAVTSHVKFRFDRYDIGQELREHMEDLYEDLLSQDIDEEQAAQLTVDYMGDSEELGKELNEAHNPVLGYVWLWVRRLFILIFIAFGLPVISVGGCRAIGTGYGAVDRFFTELYEETPENLVYTVEVNRQVKVDDMVVGVEELRYYQNGDMELKYITYQELFSTALTGTFDFYDCYLTDGENYTSQFRPRNTQIAVSGIYYEAGSITYPDFPADAKECHFIYDREGRQFDMEISLPQKEEGK